MAPNPAVMALGHGARVQSSRGERLHQSLVRILIFRQRSSARCSGPAGDPRGIEREAGRSVAIGGCLRLLPVALSRGKGGNSRGPDLLVKLGGGNQCRVVAYVELVAACHGGESRNALNLEETLKR